MVKKILILLLIFHFWALSSHAQDTSKVFSADEFMRYVLLYHPVVKQYELLSESARMEIKVARGSFDPEFDLEYNHKTFNGTNYYGYTDAGLKIPLWFGPDLKLGYENNTGQYKNPSDVTPDDGLTYLGIHIPIGANLVIDERRATLRQAQIGQKITEAERIKLINKFILNAYKEYWTWYFSYHKLKMIEKAVMLSRARWEATIGRVEGGDVAAIDSVEAGITYKERLIELSNAQIDFKNSSLLLSNYLWTENREPLELQANLIPENYQAQMLIDETQLNVKLQYALSAHPDMIKLSGKVDQLMLDRRVKYNAMLPKIDFNYKYLTTPNHYLYPDRYSWEYLQNNYKFTVGISQPIFVRKERGKYGLAKIKSEQSGYELNIARRELQNEIKASFNEIILFSQQTQNQSSLAMSTQKLLDAENERFQIGESSVFLVNARESKMIDTQIKLFDLQAKVNKSIAEFYFSSGTSILVK